MIKGEKKGYIRDYSKEHKLRSTRQKRLVCDIDRLKAERFQAILKNNDTTFSDWLNNHINEYMEEDKQKDA